MIIEAALICLAANIFHEARGEMVPGQYAVAEVTMRRAGYDQRKVCEVVYAKHQFSWTAKPHRHPAKIDSDAYLKAKKIARVVLERRMPKGFFTRGADHYHARYVAPNWAKSFTKTVRIGQHIFYRARA